MLTLYTSKGCSRCAMVKKILDQRGINYKIQLFEDLPTEEQNKFIEKTETADIYSFPVIEKEDGSLTNSLEGI